MLLFVGFREGVISNYSFWEERKYEGVGSALCLKSFWPLLKDGMLRWKMSWNGRKYEIEVAKNGEEWKAMMFWQLYWNCIKFWKPVICQSLIPAVGRPDPLEFLPAKPALLGGVTVSGVVPIRLNPTRSGNQGIIRSWFVVCGSMACHPGIIEFQYAIFFGDANPLCKSEPWK